MDYKEKYENALEKARELKNKLEKSCSLATPTGIESIFPELKVGEDEKIRKNIKIALMSMEDNLSVFYSTHHTSQKELLAWLEKQGEPQPYRGNADTMRKNLIKAFKSVGSKHWGGFDVRDIIHFLESKDAIELEKQGEKHIDEKLSNLLNRVICRFINDPYIPYSERDEVSNKIIPYVEQLEKQGEQKPIEEKVESIYKVGDFVHCITDKGFEYTYIYKRNHGAVIHAFAKYSHVTSGLLSIDDTLYEPSISTKRKATHEEICTLLQSISKHGYEWDADKKELREIDNYCKENCKGYQETGKCYADGECKAKRDAEQNPAWSEEDELMLTSTINTLKLTNGTAQIKIDWLKSLKDKVQPKQKQEWSEDDEKMLKWLCRIVHSQRLDRVITLKEESELGQWMDKWLNHNPQSHWKPTEEQIHCFKCVIDFYKTKVNDTIVLNLLNSLYNNLLKL